MSGRKRFFFLLGILTMVAVCAGTITLKVLYDAAFEEERERLVESAESQARLIEAVARFDQLYSQDDVPGGSFEATLSQLREAHSQFRGIGETGEFVLAKLEGDSIIFLLSHRHHDLEKPRPVSFTGDEAEPMRRALSGKCGTVVGLDYRGEMVLAAHEPVAVLNLGIVAKVDIAEIRAPFIRAGILASCVAGVLVLLGTILFVRVGMPLVHRLEESEKKYRQLFSRLLKK